MTTELTLKTKKGKAVTVVIQTTKLTDNSYIGFYTDISQQKELERALQKSRNMFKTLLKHLLYGPEKIP